MTREKSDLFDGFDREGAGGITKKETKMTEEAWDLILSRSSTG